MAILLAIAVVVLIIAAAILAAVWARYRPAATITTKPGHFSHHIRALAPLAQHEKERGTGEVIETLWARSPWLTRRRVKIEILGSVDPQPSDARTLDLCVATAASVPPGLCFARGSQRTFVIKVTPEQAPL